MQSIGLDNLIQRHKLIWLKVVEDLDAYTQIAGPDFTPLKLELHTCTKLMTSFLESSEQNLMVARRTRNPKHISTFGLLKSIVLGAELFSKAFALIYRVSLIIELEKGPQEALNLFEITVVGIVRAVAELAKDVRELNCGKASGVSEAYEMASATVQLKNLFNKKCLSKASTVKNVFRDFDTSLCSNEETSILGCKAYSNPKGPLRLCYLNQNSKRLNFLSLSLFKMAVTIDTLRHTTNTVMTNSLNQAQAWSSALDCPEFRYGVDCYKEKWEQDAVKLSDLCSGLSRVLLLLTAAGKEVEMRENKPNFSEVSVRPLVIELVNSAMGYVIMTHWWWYQIAIGSDHLQRLINLRKLITPIREKFQALLEKNQDIVEEYQQEFASLKSIMPQWCR